MKTKIITVLHIVILLGITATREQCQQVQNKPTHKTILKPAIQLSDGKALSSYVGFPNKRYTGKEQILFIIGGNIFYDRCMGCIGRLKTQRSKRYTTDPLSGKELEKANVYIVIKPGST